MSESEFNLLDEKWIRAMGADGSVAEHSLIDIFHEAPNLRGLAGELPTQDVSTMRLLLAIMHSSLVPRTPSETPEDDALDLWDGIWKNGKLPAEDIERYLRRYQDRFWLFDDARPFYQLAGLEKATRYGSQKLNGELSESNNKPRLFAMRSTHQKGLLTYSEAARWLLYVNAFDDNSGKPKVKGLPSPGVGWLGKLGLIWVAGDTLFETLMLNWVLVGDGREQWGPNAPIWELESPRSEERVEIKIPDNQGQLLTFQSRRILLKKQDGWVTGYSLIGGDFFQSDNPFNEQMTLFFKKPVAKNSIPVYGPKRHDPARRIWRDFSSIAQKEQGSRRPGVVDWIARLEREELLPPMLYKFKTASVKYGDKDFFAEDVFGDSIEFNLGLLEDSGKQWTENIIKEIDRTEKLIWQLGVLKGDIEKASGYRDNNQRSRRLLNEVRERSRELGYHSVDIHFRNWLASIEPGTSDIQSKSDEWLSKERGIVLGLGRDMIKSVGTNTLIGKDQKGSKSTIAAYMRFRKKVNEIMAEG